MILLKPVFIIAIVAVAMIGMMVPSAFAMDIASFVDQSKDPQHYIDRYNNEPSYKKWFDENYPQYISIYEAVGLEEPIPESMINSIEEINENDELLTKILQKIETQKKDLPKEYFEYAKLASLNINEINYNWTVLTDDNQIGTIYEFSGTVKNYVESLGESRHNIWVEHSCKPYPNIYDCNYISMTYEGPNRFVKGDQISGIGIVKDIKQHAVSGFLTINNELAPEVEGYVVFQDHISKIVNLSNDLQWAYSLGYEPKVEDGGGCLIATATYGSELSPQVQQLRELRDNQLMNTESGTQFMSTFNNVYYSFSPVIADYERENPLFKEVVKLAITPMISSLSLMENAESEFEVLSIGISVIVLNLGMYLGVPAIVVIGIRKRI